MAELKQILSQAQLEIAPAPRAYDFSDFRRKINLPKAAELNVDLLVERARREYLERTNTAFQGDTQQDKYFYGQGGFDEEAYQRAIESGVEGIDRADYEIWSESNRIEKGNELIQKYMNKAGDQASPELEAALIGMVTDRDLAISGQANIVMTRNIEAQTLFGIDATIANKEYVKATQAVLAAVEAKAISVEKGQELLKKAGTRYDQMMVMTSARAFYDAAAGSIYANGESGLTQEQIRQKNRDRYEAGRKDFIPLIKLFEHTGDILTFMKNSFEGFSDIKMIDLYTDGELDDEKLRAAELDPENIDKAALDLMIRSGFSEDDTRTYINKIIDEYEDLLRLDEMQFKANSKKAMLDYENKARSLWGIFVNGGDIDPKVTNGLINGILETVALGYSTHDDARPALSILSLYRKEEEPQHTARTRNLGLVEADGVLNLYIAEALDTDGYVQALKDIRIDGLELDSMNFSRYFLMASALDLHTDARKVISRYMDGEGASLAVANAAFKDIWDQYQKDPSLVEKTSFKDALNARLLGEQVSVRDLTGRIFKRGMTQAEGVQADGYPANKAIWNKEYWRESRIFGIDPATKVFNEQASIVAAYQEYGFNNDEAVRLSTELLEHDDLRFVSYDQDGNTEVYMVKYAGAPLAYQDPTGTEHFDVVALVSKFKTGRGTDPKDPSKFNEKDILTEFFGDYALLRFTDAKGISRLQFSKVLINDKDGRVMRYEPTTPNKRYYLNAEVYDLVNGYGENRNGWDLDPVGPNEEHQAIWDKILGESADNPVSPGETIASLGGVRTLSNWQKTKDIVSKVFEGSAEGISDFAEQNARFQGLGSYAEMTEELRNPSIAGVDDINAISLDSIEDYWTEKGHSQPILDSLVAATIMEVLKKKIKAGTVRSLEAAGVLIEQIDDAVLRDNIKRELEIEFPELAPYDTEFGL